VKKEIDCAGLADTKNVPLRALDSIFTFL